MQGGALTKSGMKKTYFAPAVSIEIEVAEEALLTGSVEAVVSSTEQANEDALGRSNDIDIWGDEE